MAKKTDLVTWAALAVVAYIAYKKFIPTANAAIPKTAAPQVPYQPDPIPVNFGVDDPTGGWD